MEQELPDTISTFFIIVSWIKRGLLHNSYENWRVREMNEILEIYGIDFLKDEEVAGTWSGHGDIGAFFAELGSHVLCLDGQLCRNINFARLKHRKLNNVAFEQFNLERRFLSF